MALRRVIQLLFLLSFAVCFVMGTLWVGSYLTPLKLSSAGGSELRVEKGWVHFEEPTRTTGGFNLVP